MTDDEWVTVTGPPVKVLIVDEAPTGVRPGGAGTTPIHGPIHPVPVRSGAPRAFPDVTCVPFIDAARAM